MAPDPRTPVLVGVGQLSRPLEVADTKVGPAEMAAEAARLAAADAGPGPSLLAAADSIRSVDIVSWSYPNFPLAVAQLVGANPRQLLKAATGGNSPQMLVNDAARAIQAGQMDVVLIAGAEAMQSRSLSRRQPKESREWLEWGSPDPDTPAPEVMGDDRPGSNDVEMAANLAIPTQVYPLFENALKMASDRSVAEHRAFIAGLWSRFSQVASRHPQAWIQEALSAEDIGTPTEDNRMVGFPYTKLMNANIYTDQAAALILCSVEAARRHGVPEDRWVFPLSGADAGDHHWVSQRHDLTRSPAMAACGRTVLDLAGASVDALGHVDLYSCFPSAVQVAARELGLPLDDNERPLTVTGGLTFFGGPVNNYVTHSIATMVDVLRADPGSIGLVTALGWYITKHSIGLYSTEPPSAGFRWESPQAEVDAGPTRTVDSAFEGTAALESFVVMHERDGSPAIATVTTLTGDGQRVLATSTDPDTMAFLMSDEANDGLDVSISDGVVEVGSP